MKFRPRINLRLLLRTEGTQNIVVLFAVARFENYRRDNVII
jgi:hypothetical protein